MTVYDGYLRKTSGGLDERVRLIQEAIAHSVQRRPDESTNEANVRHMEEFFSFLHSRFPAHRFRTEVQSIPEARVRTTDRNFVVTIPGRSQEQVLLVAHYDTWAGFSRDAPGADDNTTGEEVLKHYMVRVLCADDPPELTQVFLFSGSEECGSRGLLSQAGLTAGLLLISFAVSSANPLYLLLCIPFLPLANYRFGVTGTRHYVDDLTEKDKTLIRAAIAVDSVGEGRLYILGELLKAREGGDPLGVATAVVYEALGGKDGALDALEWAYEAREPSILWVGLTPEFAGFVTLKDEPRFQELRRRIRGP